MGYETDNILMQLNDNRNINNNNKIIYNNNKIKNKKSKKIKYEYLIPDYIIKKILSYLMNDEFSELIITDSFRQNSSNNNNNSSSSSYYYNKYRKNSSNKLKRFNLDYNYSLVSWKWFKISVKMNTFLPLRYLVSLINRNNDKDNNYFYSLLNNHFQQHLDNNGGKLSNEEKIYKKRKQLIEDEEESKRLNSCSLLYTSLKFGRIQFKHLTEIEFDKILPTWQNSWQLLSNESPNLERVSLVIVVGNDSPFDIFEKFPVNSNLKLSLKLYFNDLYCNLESIDNYTKSSRLPKNLNVEFIHCLCNINQDMNWDIVNFFRPSKLLLDSSYDSTFHYSYQNLFNFNKSIQDNNDNDISNGNNSNNKFIKEVIIKSHDFMDLKDFKEAIENNLISSMECSLLLYDVYCFEHIIPEIGGEAYWDSIAIDTNDNSYLVRKYIYDIGFALSNNTSLESLTINDYYRYYEDDDQSIYNGYNESFLDEPPVYELEQYQVSNDNDNSINPFNLTSKQFKTFATLFSESLMNNTSLKHLTISCWDTLLADNHKFQKQNQQLQDLDDTSSDYSYDDGYNSNNSNYNNNSNNSNNSNSIDISLINNSIFFKAISINQTLISLSLNEVINDNDLKCLGYSLLKNQSIKYLNLANNNLSDTDSLLEFLIYLNRRHTTTSSSSTTIINSNNNNKNNFNNNICILNLNLSKNIYSPISSPNIIYKHINNNKLSSKQIILPICLEYKINILNQNNKLNILFK